MTTTERPESAPAGRLVKKSLDKDLDRIARVEEAVRPAAHRLAALGIGLIFLVLAGGYAAISMGAMPDTFFLIAAAVLGGYMALNIGANDVANNVGPAVGSRALTMLGALVIAAVFEAAGALIAGGDVVATISKGIIDPADVADPPDLHLGDDGGADFARRSGSISRPSRCAGIDHACRRRRRHGRRHRGGGLRPR